MIFALIFIESLAASFILLMGCVICCYDDICELRAINPRTAKMQIKKF